MDDDWNYATYWPRNCDSCEVKWTGDPICWMCGRDVSDPVQARFAGLRRAAAAARRHGLGAR